MKKPRKAVDGCPHRYGGWGVGGTITSSGSIFLYKKQNKIWTLTHYKKSIVNSMAFRRK